MGWISVCVTRANHSRRLHSDSSHLRLLANIIFLSEHIKFLPLLAEAPANGGAVCSPWRRRRMTMRRKHIYPPRVFHFGLSSPDFGDILGSSESFENFDGRKFCFSWYRGAVERPKLECLEVFPPCDLLPSHDSILHMNSVLSIN